jgi:nitroreductase
MDIIGVIKRRRSVREYKKKKIPVSCLKKVVDAARYAATAMDIQPWEFVVVADRAKLKQIAALADHGKFIAGAAACIAVFSASAKYYLEDCSAAIENALLEAASLKIGSCWVAGDKKQYAPAFNGLLGAPDTHRLVGLISLGYPVSPAVFRVADKRPLAEVLHWEKF